MVYVSATLLHAEDLIWQQVSSLHSFKFIIKYIAVLDPTSNQARLTELVELTTKDSAQALCITISLKQIVRACQSEDYAWLIEFTITKLTVHITVYIATAFISNSK